MPSTASFTYRVCARRPARRPERSLKRLPSSLLVTKRKRGSVSGKPGEALHPEREPPEILEQLHRTIGEYPRTLRSGGRRPVPAGAGAIGRRQSDRVVVSHGVDPNFHGGTSEKKELAPNRRGSVVLGEIADYIDRYGYDVQPLTCGFSPAKPSRCTR